MEKMLTKVYNYNKVILIDEDAPRRFPGLYFKIDDGVKRSYAIFTSETMGGIIEENPPKELKFDTHMNIEEWKPINGRILSTLITEFCEEKDSLETHMKVK